ncbi:YtxH domain-containing protein [Patescibacteria group bacterium]|nr:YtxH domain-containing protein [Patescibacteria group bacterium]
MKKTKKKKDGMRVAKGALVGAALGAAAGLLLAPESGDRLRKDMTKHAARLYKHAAPKLKKLSAMGEKEYKDVMQKALAAYGKAQELSGPELKTLQKHAEDTWNIVKKNLQ